MEIKVRPWQGAGRTLYEIVSSTSGGMVSEDWLTQEEVDEMATEFLDSTALNGICRDGVVGKLVELNIIDQEMIEEYREE